MSGVWYLILAFLLWGFLPLYWKVLDKIPAGEILAHRILWSFVFCSLILLFYGRWHRIKEAVSTFSSIIGITLSSIFISFNWFIYIWAVNHNQIVEASLGYYINPLLNTLFGMIILKERLNFWQAVALVLATVGVAIVTLQYGRIPLIALGLALSFTFYGLFKKLIKVDAITGLTLETVCVLPIAILFLLYRGFDTALTLNLSTMHLLLLIFSGVVTATPLLLFAQGAKKVSLSTVGFIQYLAPTISLLLGVLVYGEAFTVVHAITFSFIWLALVLYALSQKEFLIQRQPKYFKISKSN